jgi:predicted nucleic acid-binding protein
MMVVDSNVWIDYLNGLSSWRTDLLASEIPNDSIIVGDIILLEVLQGIRDDRHYKRVKSSLTAFHSANMFNASLALEAAENYRHLRKMGVTVRKSIDNIIATFCIRNDLPLLTSDQDFEPFAKYLKLQLI